MASNYNAYEVNEGDVLERVEALCKYATQGGSFTDSSTVTLVEVEMFIDDAYIFIQGELARNGYATTQTAAAVKRVLQMIQALDAASSVELAMPVNDSGDDNKRVSGVVGRRDRLITDYLRGDALEQLGATRSRSKSQYLEGTGRSIDRKEAVYDNSDVVPARFPRGFGQRRDVPSRSGVHTPSGADADL